MKTIQLLFLVITANLFFSCQADSQNWYGKGIKGEGPLVTKTIELRDFHAIGLAIDADVYLSQGSQSVKIQAQQNILDNISKDVADKNWNIKYQKNVGNHEPVKIWISVPDLTNLAISGSGNIIGESVFRGLGSLGLAVSGSGNVDLEANTTKLSAAISGSGDMKLRGNTGDFNISISGSGNVEAGGLQASNCTVAIVGSGDATVHATSDLNVSIAGSGDVFYEGKPNVRSKIAGSGDVKSL